VAPFLLVHQKDELTKMPVANCGHVAGETAQGPSAFVIENEPELQIERARDFKKTCFVIEHGRAIRDRFRMLGRNIVARNRSRRVIDEPSRGIGKKPSNVNDAAKRFASANFSGETREGFHISPVRVYVDQLGSMGSFPTSEGQDKDDIAPVGWGQ
jgi:hypothetical protein